jgi:hypothetical protein
VRRLPRSPRCDRARRPRTSGLGNLRPNGPGWRDGNRGTVRRRLLRTSPERHGASASPQNNGRRFSPGGAPAPDFATHVEYRVYLKLRAQSERRQTGAVGCTTAPHPSNPLAPRRIVYASDKDTSASGSLPSLTGSAGSPRADLPSRRSHSAADLRISSNSAASCSSKAAWCLASTCALKSS